MHEMQTIVNVDPGICLSRGSTWLRCAKMAERIKMLFGVNTPGGPWNIVLNGGFDLPPQRGVGDIILNFLNPFVSPERLKLEISNFARI